MTTITISDTSHFIFLLSVGHAGYAEQGKDIVCSAISCLMFSYYYAVKELYGDANIDIKDGYCKITYSGCDIDKARTMLRVFKAGVNALAENYPEHVKVGVS